uniref:Uncharacterized protein n=1 Tax=Mycena chlorophos TaxID=658473 RepID=A0ABQ0KYM5_MYCCL|nr:predicted protein [Mycena chlorophos]
MISASGRLSLAYSFALSRRDAVVLRRLPLVGRRWVHVRLFTNHDCPFAPFPPSSPRRHIHPASPPRDGDSGALSGDMREARQLDGSSERDIQFGRCASADSTSRRKHECNVSIAASCSPSRLVATRPIRDCELGGQASSSASRRAGKGVEQMNEGTGKLQQAQGVFRPAVAGSSSRLPNGPAEVLASEVLDDEVLASEVLDDDTTDPPWTGLHLRRALLSARHMQEPSCHILAHPDDDLRSIRARSTSRGASRRLATR